MVHELPTESGHGYNPVLPMKDNSSGLLVDIEDGDGVFVRTAHHDGVFVSKSMNAYLGGIRVYDVIPYETVVQIDDCGVTNKSFGELNLV